MADAPRKVVPCGIPSTNPGFPAEQATPIPFTCDTAGVQYVINVDGGGFVFNLLPTDQTLIAGSSSPTALPVLAFNYDYDAVNAVWTVGPAVNNSVAALAVDFAASSMRVANFQYIYDSANDVYARLKGLANAAPSVESSASALNLPVVNYGYIASTDSGGALVWTQITAVDINHVGNLGQSVQVAECPDTPNHNAPAVNTAATVSFSGSNNGPVKISGIGYSITAVAAIAAPVLIQLHEDTTGANTLIWSTRELVPAGQAKTVMLPVNLTANVDCTLTVAAPGATNFVTATLIANSTIGNGAP